MWHRGSVAHLVQSTLSIANFPSLPFQPLLAKTCNILTRAIPEVVHTVWKAMLEIDFFLTLQNYIRSPFSQPVDIDHGYFSYVLDFLIITFIIIITTFSALSLFCWQASLSSFTLDLSFCVRLHTAFSDSALSTPVLCLESWHKCYFLRCYR